MKELIIPLLIALLGIVAGIIVSRYYFLRSIKTSLTPYVYKFGRAFDVLDSLRSKLTVLVDGAEVKDLHVAEFFVMNDGERPIRDCAAHLRLPVPAAARVIEARIVYVRPVGLLMDLVQTLLPAGSASIEFRFPLLNRDDAFLVRILWDGQVALDDWQFHIAADSLPPILKPRRIPLPLPYLQEDKAPAPVNWKVVRWGSVAITFSLLCAYVFFPSTDDYAFSSIADYLNFFSAQLNLLMLCAVSIGVTYFFGFWRPANQRRFFIPPDVK